MIISKFIIIAIASVICDAVVGHLDGSVKWHEDQPNSNKFLEENTENSAASNVVMNHSCECTDHHDATSICCQRNSITDERTVDQMRRGCGVRNVGGIGKPSQAVKKGSAQFGEFPWFVTIFIKYYSIGKGDESLTFNGAGSLIHPRVVMTAAHKIKSRSILELKLRLGEWNVTSKSEPLPYQDIHIKKIIYPPRYNAEHTLPDIALLILNGTAKLNYHISPICLVENLQDVDETSCVISGWAKESNFFFLKSVTLPLVNHPKCQEILRKIPTKETYKLHKSFICAGGTEGADACNSDGGGPLACRLKDDPARYAQVGITSWGIGCGAKDVSGVYTNVIYQYKWINKVIQEHFPNKEDSADSIEVSYFALTSSFLTFIVNWKLVIKAF